MEALSLKNLGVRRSLCLGFSMPLIFFGFVVGGVLLQSRVEGDQTISNGMLFIFGIMIIIGIVLFREGLSPRDWYTKEEYAKLKGNVRKITIAKHSTDYEKEIDNEKDKKAFSKLVAEYLNAFQAWAPIATMYFGPGYKPMDAGTAGVLGAAFGGVSMGVAADYSARTKMEEYREREADAARWNKIRDDLRKTLDKCEEQMIEIIEKYPKVKQMFDEDEKKDEKRLREKVRIKGVDPIWKT